MTTSDSTSNAVDRPPTPWWVYPLLVVVLVVAILARVYLLRFTPGWYADEGTYIEIATRMMNGEQRYLALGQSTLVAARLPLFHLILAGLFSLFGRDILTVRMFTVACSVLIVLLLFVLGRRMWGNKLALLAAALYGIYPNAVLYSRFGFLYNPLALLNLILFYALWRFISGGRGYWLVVASLSVSLSLVTNASALPMIGFVVLFLLLKRRSALWWALLLIACLPVLYGVWMMIEAPQAFLYDLGYMFGRVGGSWLHKVFYAVWNYMRLLLWDAWIPLGAFGLTRLRPHQGRLYTQVFFWYSLFTTVTGVPEIVGLGYHYVIPLLPWVAVGVAAFALWAFPRLVAELEDLYGRTWARLPWKTPEGELMRLLRRHSQAFVVGLIVFWVLISPFIGMAIQARFEPGLASAQVEQVTIRSFRDVEAVVAYVNHHAAPEDVVLAPPHIAWMVGAQVASFQQAVAYTGGETHDYPSDIPRDRFLFDCSVQNARYVLLWEGWREWLGGKWPDVEEIFQVIEAWPIVFDRGEWHVFANPKRLESTP